MSETVYPETEEHICTGEAQGEGAMLRNGESYLTHWMIRSNKSPSCYARNGGEITNEEWCRHEIDRLRKAGIDARMVEKTYANGQEAVAIVRGSQKV